MKKYVTPSIETYIFNTSDIMSISPNVDKDNNPVAGGGIDYDLEDLM